MHITINGIPQTLTLYTFSKPAVKPGKGLKEFTVSQHRIEPYGVAE
jgi:hypothetical protein